MLAGFPSTKDKLPPDVCIRDFQLDDIAFVLEYWLSPDNRSYHLARGTDPQNWIDSSRETAAFKRIVETSINARVHSAATVLLNGFPVGHVLLNDVREPSRQRMHFHMWRNKIARQSLTDTIRMTKIIIGRSLDYFFETHSLKAITGDVAVANLAANFVLARMGFTPAEMVEEAYLGKRQSYNRYVFERLGLASNK